MPKPLLRPACRVCGHLLVDAELALDGLVTATGAVLPWPGDATPEGYEDVPLCAQCLGAFVAWSRRRAVEEKGT